MQEQEVESFHHFPSVAQFHSFILHVEEGHFKEWKNIIRFANERKKREAILVTLLFWL